MELQLCNLHLRLCNLPKANHPWSTWLTAEEGRPENAVAQPEQGTAALAKLQPRCSSGSTAVPVVADPKSNHTQLQTRCSELTAGHPVLARGKPSIASPSRNQGCRTPASNSNRLCWWNAAADFHQGRANCIQGMETGSLLRCTGSRMLQGKRFSQCTWLSSETGSQTEATELPWLEIFRNAAQSPNQFYLTLELAPFEHRVCLDHLHKSLPTGLWWQYRYPDLPYNHMN